jgi:ribosome-associated protein
LRQVPTMDVTSPAPGFADDDRTIAPGVTLGEGALAFTFSRGGGPGGQHVNKVSTRCTLTLQLTSLAEAMPDDAVRRLRSLAGARLASDPERLIITSADSRSQVANRRACLAKLRALVVASLRRPKVRKATRPSRAAKRRRLDAKRRRGEIKSQRRPHGEATD